jgi:hypothetical protein
MLQHIIVITKIIIDCIKEIFEKKLEINTLYKFIVES